MRKNHWRDVSCTGRELVEEWRVSRHLSIAAAGRALRLGKNSRQRLWAFLRQGVGLGKSDELRVARIMGVPFEVIAFTPTSRSHSPPHRKTSGV